MIDLTQQITMGQIAFALIVIAFALVYIAFGKKSTRHVKRRRNV